MPRLISRHEANQIRQMPLGKWAGCGEVEEITGTGRAVCRCCGKCIAKNDIALAIVYDFCGNGLAGDPWTGTIIQIHKTC